MDRSNVTIRSNVFVRREPLVEDDRTFLAQVRGRSALGQLLRRLEPRRELQGPVARRYFTREQLAWAARVGRCGECNAFPEGPVCVDGEIEVQFRCPRGTCAAPRHQPHVLSLRQEVIRRCVDVFQKPLSDIVQDALRLELPDDSQGRGVAAATDRVPAVIHLTLTQKHFNSDHDIEMALERLLTAGGHE